MCKQEPGHSGLLEEPGQDRAAAERPTRTATTRTRSAPRYASPPGQDDGDWIEYNTVEYNIVEEIRNLDHVANLKWLDPNFNNVTEIKIKRLEQGAEVHAGAGRRCGGEEREQLWGGGTE